MLLQQHVLAGHMMPTACRTKSQDTVSRICFAVDAQIALHSRSLFLTITLWQMTAEFLAARLAARLHSVFLHNYKGQQSIPISWMILYARGQDSCGINVSVNNKFVCCVCAR